MALLLSVAGCRHTCCPPPSSQAEGTRIYQVRGVIREIKDDGRVAVIKHEEIPGFMAAMTMPFDVKEPAEILTTRPGDRVAFRMTVTETDGWIDRIEVLERGTPVDDKPKVEGVRVTRVVDELSEGDLLPDYRFTNELRQPVLLSQFQGQALGLTFIYTRCPYPTFCPRQNQNFADAARRLTEMPDGPTNWHLLSLTFDPEHDTPSVLRAYAKRYGYDPQRWNFLTGPIIDIDAITEQFGMFFARDGEGFSHNVRTVVIDARGRIQKIYVGNDWTAEDFATEIAKAARVP